jgi:ribonuclease D
MRLAVNARRAFVINCAIFCQTINLQPLAHATDQPSLARIEEMHPRTVRHDGETILAIIKNVAALPPSEWPPAAGAVAD